MIAPSHPRRFSGWARRLGCFGIVLMGALCLGLIGFRLWMWRVHRGAERRVEHSAKSLPSRAKWAGDPVKRGPSWKPGIPLSEVPRLGPGLSGEDQSRLQAFASEIAAIADFLERCGRVAEGGRIDFRAVLESLGVTLPPGTTDAEAAAAFLAEAERFAAFLADWKAAVSAGTWDTSKADGWHSSVTSAFASVPRLLRIMAEAYWQSGDAASAWGTVTVMAATAERAFDTSHLHSHGSGFASAGILAQTLAGGLAAGVWSDDQLRAVPGLAASLDPVGHLPGFAAAAKHTLDLWATKPDASPAGSPIRFQITDPINSAISLAHGAMDSSQQRRLDNFSLIKAVMDADAASFNYETRTLMPAADRAAFDPLAGIQDDWFSALYLAPAWSVRDFEEESPLGMVVTAQSRIDQAAIAARLELEKRSTGEYPARLPDDLPHDPATGQPYRYELLPTGGFRLWGLGLDQSDQGGHVRSDVVWVTTD